MIKVIGVPVRVHSRTKEMIEKLQSRLRLRELKITQQELIDNAIEYVRVREDDFMRFLTKADVSPEEDPLWKLIHDPIDMGKTDAKKVDEYLYGGT
ncbi:MAG: hypothetical protein QMC85_06350 [Methanocellales archaeon]|nr:hypothetical protein [Methanocellales archaeon]